MKNLDLFTRKMREAREAKNLTLSELGGIVGASDTTLSRYERGDWQRADVILLLAIFQALDLDWVTMLDLAGLTPQRPASKPGELPPDVARALDVEPWLQDVVRKASGLPPRQRDAVIRYLAALLGEENGPESPSGSQ